MVDRTLSPEEIEQFATCGFVIVEDLLSADEVEVVQETTRRELATSVSILDRRDADGIATRLVLRNELGDDVYSAIVRAPRVVDRIETLLGGEVYHYHHKLMVKDARVGGAWEWHQDYGYWYENGCLFPDLASCLIAINRATLANGCLEVLEGSHRIGRIDHVRVGDQDAADPERVAWALERMPVVPCELAPGSAVFLDCNLLHRSAQNRSDHARLSLIACYNRASNDPYKDHHHPRYSPLAKGTDAEVLEIGRGRLRDRVADASSRRNPPA